MRIGFIVNDLIGGFQQVLWSGVQKAALDLHVQCLTLPGSFLDATEKIYQPHNILYDFLNGTGVDGFVIASSTFSSYNTMEEVAAFCRKFNIPYTSVGVKMNDAPSVLVDNSSGIIDMANHFIDVHGYKDIGFLQGPHNNPEAQTRYQAYEKVLTDHGLSVNPNWVLEGNFVEESGYRNMKAIWESGQRPRAMMAANDQMLLGAVQYLEEQNVDIPAEIALGGFDNIMETRFSKVPLSTVEQPIQHQSYTAVELLKEYIKTGTSPKDVVLETEALYRESCGCFSKTIMSVGEDIIKDRELSVTPDQSLETILEAILVECLNVNLDECQCHRHFAPVIKQMQEYIDDPTYENQIRYLQIISVILSQSDITESILEDWNNVFTAMRQAIDFIDETKGHIASPLIQKSYILISEKMEQALSSRSIRQTHGFAQMQESLQKLMEAYDMESLLSSLSTELDGIGLDCFYLTFFDGEPKTYSELGGKMPAKSFLKMNYHSRKSHPIPPEGFPSHDIIPKELFKQEQNYALLCQPIFFEEKITGLMICNSGEQRGEFFESLRSQLSSSVRAGLMMEDLKRNQSILARRNEAIQEQLVPMLRAISDVTRITSEKIEAIEEAARQIRESQATFTRTTESVENISERARYMMDLIKIIDDISERINILSINASIESARAGQHGKGFGVIAGEVRKLADSTAENATQTNETLKDVVRSISESRDSSQKSLETYKDIQNEIVALSESLSEIQDRMNKLSEFSQRIMGIINA